MTPKELWVVRYPDAPGRQYAYPTRECAAEMHPGYPPERYIKAEPDHALMPKIVVDASLPAGTIEVRHAGGVLRMVNIGL